MDANGLYITTNEFDLFTPGRFHGAQIYRHFQAQPDFRCANDNVVQFDTTALAANAAFRIFRALLCFPRISPGTDFRSDNGGTEFLLSSFAVFSNTGAFNELVPWQLTNTQSLDGATPSVNLAHWNRQYHHLCCSSEFNTESRSVPAGAVSC